MGILDLGLDWDTVLQEVAHKVMEVCEERVLTEDMVVPLADLFRRWCKELDSRQKADFISYILPKISNKITGSNAFIIGFKKAWVSAVGGNTGGFFGLGRKTKNIIIDKIRDTILKKRRCCIKEFTEQYERAPEEGLLEPWCDSEEEPPAKKTSSKRKFNKHNVAESLGWMMEPCIREHLGLTGICGGIRGQSDWRNSWNTVLRNLLEPVVGIERYRVFGVCKNPQLLEKPHKTEKACDKVGNCEWVYDPDYDVDNWRCSNSQCNKGITLDHKCTKCHGKKVLPSKSCDCEGDERCPKCICCKCAGDGRKVELCHNCDGTGKPKEYTTKTCETTSILDDLRDATLPVFFEWMDNLSKDERNRLIDTIMASKSCFTRFGLNWIYGWGKHSKKNKFYNTIKAKVETSIEKYITILEPQVQELAASTGEIYNDSVSTEVSDDSDRRRRLLFPDINSDSGSETRVGYSGELDETVSSDRRRRLLFPDMQRLARTETDHSS